MVDFIQHALKTTSLIYNHFYHMANYMTKWALIASEPQCCWILLLDYHTIADYTMITSYLHHMITQIKQFFSYQ